ncbi:glucose-methanol-choline oxidoreductase [Xylariales sp. PMI_506]|nr:glucose-methanol-choline oxidoreductase [Xylariales sp. PMI_506]
MLNSLEDRVARRKGLRFALHLVERFQTSKYPHKAKPLLTPNVSSGKHWREICDEELNKYMDLNSNSSLHLSSACAMGLERNGGVVDEALRVHGFDNLRIADTSVFPLIPACHTMAPVFLFAKRCSDFIKEQFKDMHDDLT